MIYGSDETPAAVLRTFSGGELATSAGGLTPFNTAGLSNANDAHIAADNQLFLAGDVRANEKVELSVDHDLDLTTTGSIPSTSLCPKEISSSIPTPQALRSSPSIAPTSTRGRVRSGISICRRRTASSAPACFE